MIEFAQFFAQQKNLWAPKLKKMGFFDKNEEKIVRSLTSLSSLENLLYASLT